MITVYTKAGCAYTPVVLRTLDEEGVPYEQKNISDPAVADELMKKSGNLQTPYIVDIDGDVAMGESKAIVEYVVKKYGKKDQTDGTVAATKVAATDGHAKDAEKGWFDIGDDGSSFGDSGSDGGGGGSGD